MTALRLTAEAGHWETAMALAEMGAEVPEEGLAVKANEDEERSASGERTATATRALENPGTVVLTSRLAEQLLGDFAMAASVGFPDAKLQCMAAAERWGFAPTE